MMLEVAPDKKYIAGGIWKKRERIRENRSTYELSKDFGEGKRQYYGKCEEVKVNFTKMASNPYFIEPNCTKSRTMRNLVKSKLPKY